MKLATRPRPAAPSEANDPAAPAAAVDRDLAGQKGAGRNRALRIAIGIAQWAACALVAVGYLWLLAKVGPEARIVAITFPSAITAALLREHRFSLPAWRRWLVLWLLPFVVMEEYRLPVFFIAMTWAFHQFWIVERTTPWADVIGLAKQATGGTDSGPSDTGGTDTPKSAADNASKATGQGHKSPGPTTTSVTGKTRTATPTQSRTKRGATRGAKTSPKGSKAGTR